MEPVFRKRLNIGIKMKAPVEGCPRFVDLALITIPVHVCWKYELEMKKSATLSLAHSKLVKRCSAQNFLDGASEQSCLDTMDPNTWDRRRAGRASLSSTCNNVRASRTQA